MGEKVAAGAQLNNDSDDFEQLFDSIARQVQQAQTAGPPPATDGTAPCERTTADVISRVGHLTRLLHDNLRALGYDKLLEKAAAAMPDARDRLSYIAAMTEQAATRALNAAEVAKPIQEELARDASELAQGWQKLHERQLTVADFRQLVADTRAYLGNVPAQAGATNEQLTEIIMAQDFQDLTGQVIKKITEMVQSLEQEMVKLLLDYIPPEKRASAIPGLMNGPAIGTEGRNDIVTNQNQVDELLESLGF